MKLLQQLNEENMLKCQQAVQYNIDNKIPLTESVFRPGSDMFIAYFQYLKENINTLNISDDMKEILNNGLGTIGLYENRQVPLYLPFINEEDSDVELNKPKRGGSKKYYVYVKDPQTGNIKKVSFGQKGMSVKINDKQAAKAFAARFDCKNKKDITTASYWSCHLPMYSELVGLTGGGNYYW